MRNNWKLSVFVVGLGLALTANVFGQASAINGEITGTVTDPSGAAISGAPNLLARPATYPVCDGEKTLP